MSSLLINGGKPLSGKIKPSGNKNAVLPMLCATLLSTDEIELTNVPEISDVDKILSYFRGLGSSVEWDKGKSIIKVKHAKDLEDSEEIYLPAGIRSSVLLIAPSLYRFKKIIFDIDSKGCALGVREIDPHIEVVQSFGCSFENKSPFVFRNVDGTSGADVWLDYASVTTTETFLMLAAISKGKSSITNGACEPHVQEFCYFLISMGAKISGIGTSKLEVEGITNLTGTSYRIPDDHHEIATLLMIGGVTGGSILVETDMNEHMTLIIRQLKKIGINILNEKSGIRVNGSNFKVENPYTNELISKVEASPWPYFPADLLPQLIGSTVGCKGEVLFWNKVYEGALGWVGELSKFGARVHLSDPHRLLVVGTEKLRPAIVEAPYIIRVVLGLFIVALQVKGVSVIKNADPINRAHPNFVDKMKSLGADVEWRE